MKARRLPIEDHLARIQAEQGDAVMAQSRSALFLETARTLGFQFVTVILRELERSALTGLRVSTDPGQAARLLGCINTIEHIRRSLTGLLPADQVAGVNWDDEESEDYLSPLDLDDAPTGQVR
jgi:hypothetical protein